MSCNVDFYYVEMSPPSRSAWMVLEELGISYNSHLVDMRNGEHKTPEFKKINVRQKVPALADGELGIGESRVIASYLVNEYGDKMNMQYLYPSENKKRAVVDQHLYISENIFEQIISYLNLGGVLFRGESKNDEKITEARKALQFIEDLLERNTFVVANHLTIADFFYYVAVGLLEVVDFDEFTNYPKLVAWREKMKSKPYHKKTFEDPMKKFKDLYQKK